MRKISRPLALLSVVGAGLLYSVSALAVDGSASVDGQPVANACAAAGTASNSAPVMPSASCTCMMNMMAPHPDACPKVAAPTGVLKAAADADSTQTPLINTAGGSAKPDSGSKGGVAVPGQSNGVIVVYN